MPYFFSQRPIQIHGPQFNDEMHQPRKEALGQQLYNPSTPRGQHVIGESTIQGWTALIHTHQRLAPQNLQAIVQIGRPGLVESMQQWQQQSMGAPGNFPKAGRKVHQARFDIQFSSDSDMVFFRAGF
jgi:hypothetical protein